MSSYLDWNDRIARRVFRPDMAGRNVSLYVNTDTIKEVAPPGEGLTDFVREVKLGPWFAKRGGLCERAIQTFQGWRERVELELPPYIAYLALFVLAAGTEGEFAANAYYPRLRQLAGIPGDGQPPGFWEMLRLWDDLERWSVQDRKGDLGVFRVTRSGKWVHVGVPLGQTVLTEGERRALSAVFSRAGLDPKSPISDQALATAVRAHGGGILSNKTVQRLGKQRDAEMFPVLIDAIAQELSDWDGQLIDEARRSSSFAPVRLCAELDAVAGRIRCQLRCRTAVALPEAGLRLSTPLGDLTVTEELPGWSRPLARIAGDVLDASSLDWSMGFSAMTDDGKWTVRWPGADVRVLAVGSPEGLPGLVEVFTIGNGEGLFVLFSDAAWPRLKAWTSRSCERFRELTVASGLPNGWHLASVARVHPDRTMLESYPVLAGAETVRLQLIGGVKSGSGSSYFSFALPRIAAMGLADGDRVLVNSADLIAAGGGQYEIPPGLQAADHLVVEVRRGDEPVRSQSIWIVKDFDWRAAARNAVWLDVNANVSPDAQPRVSGACILEAESSPEDFPSDALLVPGLANAKRVLFLGRAVGEVAAWPTEPQPSWPTIWAVIPDRKYTFLFCAPPGINPEPSPILRGRRRLRRLWKDVLWYRRKRARHLRQPTVRRLLRAYRAVARDA